MATKKQVLNVETKVNEIDGMTLVLIPNGEFMMGAPDNDSLAARNEKPQVKVTLTKSQWLSTTQVTQQSIQKSSFRCPSASFRSSSCISSSPLFRVVPLEAVRSCGGARLQSRSARWVGAGWSGRPMRDRSANGCLN